MTFSGIVTQGVLRLEEVRGTARQWRTMAPIMVTWLDGDLPGFPDRRVIAPMGTITDLASVPWWGRWLVSVVGIWRRAAVIHDYLYTVRVGSRREVDALFHGHLRAEGVGRTLAWTMWAAVRVGGPRWRTTHPAGCRNPDRA